MTALVLVRYGELALKSPPVRREFEASLRKNILDQFVTDGLAGRLRSDHGHLYAEANAAEPAVRVLRRVFGVTSVSVVTETSSERAAIRDRVLELAEPRLRPGSSFAIRARRTGSHPFTSQELARDLGSDVLDRFPDRQLRVDLDHPQVEVFVEVRGPRTYLYFDRVPGPGGLPLGVAGRLVAYVDGPRGALGAYLMMKRGCRVGLVASPSGEPLVREVLRRYDPSARLATSAPERPEWSRTLADLADSSRAEGIVLPLTIDDYPSARTEWGDRVLFSPTVGLTDAEVEARWSQVAAVAS
jgi:tRNA uracil 4-sulfurtransferase